MGRLNRARKSRVWGRWFRCAAEALFPAKCLGCGRLFGRFSDARAAGETETGASAEALALHFCPSCREPWTRVSSPLCVRCGLVFKSREGPDHLCGRCLERAGGFSRARAAGLYDGYLRLAIHALKFKGHVHLAGPLGDLLFGVFQRDWPTADIDLVAPVPLHRRRFRQRGFNQAYLLVRRWTLPGGTLVQRDLLVRSRATAPQTGLDRRQRRLNIKNAFSVRRPGQSAGRRVLLVDDVFTTGSTVEACAEALIRDGAKRVDVLTLARAL